MNFNQLKAEFDMGVRRVVTFNAGIENLEGAADENMRARVSLVMASRHDGINVTFDYTEFEAYNAEFEKTTYWDKEKRPTLSARQAGMYGPQELFYFEPNDDVSQYFSFDSEAPHRLHETYRAEKAAGTTSLSYVSWLEAKLVCLGVGSVE